MLLNSLIAVPAGTTLQERTVTRQVSRSSPVVAAIGSGSIASYQGTTTLITPAPAPVTYAGASSNATFDFPQVVGHLHKLTMSNLTNNVVATYSDSTAMESFPTATVSGCGAAAFKGTCRTVFTNTATGLKPANVEINTANRSVLKPLMAAGFANADLDVLISRVIAGKSNGTSYVPKLGGIDRSTVAIVEPSPSAGSGRPTMIYVGALDGMMHAFCGEAKAGTACTVAGRELWAYVPRTQLGRLRKNTARIDGSPRVVDAMVGGAWKTILVFQTGAGNPAVAADAPAVIALDITDPSAPSVLWERTTPATRTALEQGVGLGVAIGPIGKDTLAFIATANGGTGSAAIVVHAVDIATGNTRTGAMDPPTWKFTQTYPAPRVAANVAVPASAIPGGVTLADVKREGKITRVLVPTLYGDVYLLDAADGTNALGGTKALFSFASDLHPIGASVSLYRNTTEGPLYAIAVSGGYADPVSTVWSPGTTNQYAVSFAVETPAATAPVNDTSNYAATIRPWVLDLGLGQRAFGQAVIAGAEVFIATDTADANLEDFGVSATATGTLQRIALATGSVKSTTALPGGANGVDVSSDGRVIAGAGNGAKRIDSASFDANGVAVELAIEAVMKRRFWLAD